MKWLILCLSISSLLQIGCVSVNDGQAGRQTAPADRLHKILAGEILAPAQCAVVLRSVSTGATVFAHDAAKQMTPASNMKLVTAAAAYLGLGPEFRFETRLVPDGEVKSGVLEGDLYIISNGDPTLREEFFEDPTEVFAGWAEQLKSQGVTRVAGRVAVPRQWVHWGAGWALDDLPWAYSARPSRLQLFANSVTYQWSSKALSEADPKPDADPPEVVDLLFNKGSEDDLSKEGKGARELPEEIAWLALEGFITPGDRWRAAIHEPEEVYARVVARTLTENGIAVNGAGATEWIREGDLAKSDPLLIHHSPPLEEILRVMLKKSDNLIAETVIRALGEKSAGTYSFAAGAGAARGLLLPLGVDLARARYADGSGLSRYNHISADQICRILIAMVRGGTGTAEEWSSLLPVAGRDGTLTDRFRGTALAGNLTAKTGSMSSIRALSGYFRGASGEQYVFSILVNGHLADGPKVDECLGRLLELCYEDL